jgi:hypothetical protein
MSLFLGTYEHMIPTKVHISLHTHIHIITYTHTYIYNYIYIHSSSPGGVQHRIARCGAPPLVIEGIG